MAKREMKSWSGKDWFWALVGELAFYFSLYYALMLLDVGANLYVSSLILLVLLNVGFFACPVTRKHFM